MFSLEVLIAIAILATAIGYIMINPEQNEAINLFTTIKNQNNRINAIYFNENPTNSDGENIICGEYIIYKSQTIIKKQLCEGYPWKVLQQ